MCRIWGVCRVSGKASNGEAEAINVNELNDEELRENLTKHGIEVGPIVGKCLLCF